MLETLGRACGQQTDVIVPWAACRHERAGVRGRQRVWAALQVPAGTAGSINRLNGTQDGGLGAVQVPCLACRPWGSGGTVQQRLTTPPPALAVHLCSTVEAAGGIRRPFGTLWRTSF